MNHAEFDWDFENITHIARHGVTPEEAEDVLWSHTKFVGSRVEHGEFRHAEIGRTASGRFLFVAWTKRGVKVRVVTAFPPNAKLKREFLAFEGM